VSPAAPRETTTERVIGPALPAVAGAGYGSRPAPLQGSHDTRPDWAQTVHASTGDGAPTVLEALRTTRVPSQVAHLIRPLPLQAQHIPPLVIVRR
jgi:hypothetical protein